MLWFIHIASKLRVHGVSILNSWLSSILDLVDYTEEAEKWQSIFLYFRLTTVSGPFSDIYSVRTLLHMVIYVAYRVFPTPCQKVLQCFWASRLDWKLACRKQAVSGGCVISFYKTKYVLWFRICRVHITVPLS